jgi:hypothetical protein
MAEQLFTAKGEAKGKRQDRKEQLFTARRETEIERRDRDREGRQR